jgi:hypothetical protein
VTPPLPMHAAASTVHLLSGSRTLSKSDFKLARTCDAKLFFRENGYPDNRDADPYLTLLAEGGYMVEALAKASYSDGIQLEYGRNVAADFARTVEQLQQDTVTLFEATLLVGRRQARVDILEKKGNVVRLVEVKAKSFDGAEHARLLAEGKRGALRGTRKPYKILADWEEKLEDITFQVLLLERVLPPGTIIKPYLLLVDRSKNAAMDGIPALFELVRGASRDGANRLLTARYVGSREDLPKLNLLTEVDVSEEVLMLREEVEAATTRFEALLDAPLTTYTAGLERGAKCSRCEYRLKPLSADDGFSHCWGLLAEPRPHMLELFSIGTAKAPDKSPLVEWMISQNKASLLEIPEDGLTTKDGTIGPTSERQRRQIEYTGRNEVFVGPHLHSKVQALSGPVHFIDFETSRLALPYHRGMRPYGLVTFQWSCHRTADAGHKPSHMDWLNNSDVWPNQLFAESLRAAIGDTGPVLTWSHFEATTLRQIIEDLAAFGSDVPNLVAWMKDVFENRIVDLHEWARLDFYHPGMGGRTSIKVVLDALWRSDGIMRRQFAEWTGFPADESRDPYSSLPPVEINGIQQEVHEGTGAMRAYQEMMYGATKRDPETSTRWSSLLRQYCSLDTLSMVLIVEHWRRQVGRS